MEFFCAALWATGSVAAGAVSVRLLAHRPIAGRRIPAYLALCAAAGAAGGWAAFHNAGPGAWPRLLAVMLVLAGSGAVDLLERRIPNLFPLLLTACGVLAAAIGFVLHSEQAMPMLIGGLIGAAVMLAALLLCRRLSRGGIGLGDVKLLAALAFLIGLYGAFSTLLFAQLSALVCAVVLLALRRATLRDSIPFAPFFLIGFAVTLLLGTF